MLVLILSVRTWTALSLLQMEAGCAQTEGLPRPELRYSDSEWEGRMRASDWVLSPLKECWRPDIFNWKGLPTHRRLPARPALYFTASKKKRGPTARLPFWYDGYFFIYWKATSLLHRRSFTRHPSVCRVWLPKHQWLNEGCRQIRSWWVAVEQRGVYFCINPWPSGAPPCGLGYANC